MIASRVWLCTGSGSALVAALTLVRFYNVPPVGPRSDEDTAEQPNATTASKRCRQHVPEISIAFVLRYGGSLEGGILLPPDLHVPLR